MSDVLCGGELPEALALFRGLDVLVGREVIGNQRYLVFVEHLILAEFGKLADGHRTGDVISEHQIQFCHGNIQNRPFPAGIRRRPRCRSRL